MTAVLQSYITGKWTTPEGDADPLVNAATGDEVARYAVGSVDLAAVVAYGREVGDPPCAR